jgi:hypothetical protein
VDRAGELNLERALYDALRYTHTLLSTPIPEDVTRRVERFGPGKWLSSLMDNLFQQSFMVEHLGSVTTEMLCARALLAMRGHWLRMPAHLFVVPFY